MVQVRGTYLLHIHILCICVKILNTNTQKITWKNKQKYSQEVSTRLRLQSKKNRTESMGNGTQIKKKRTHHIKKQKCLFGASIGILARAPFER